MPRRPLARTVLAWCFLAALPGQAQTTTSGAQTTAPGVLIASAPAAQGQALRTGAGAPAPGPLRLTLPAGSEATASDQLPPGSQIPVGPARDGFVPRESFDGLVQRNGWFIPGTSSSQQLIAPLRAQLEDSGWQILAECDTRACGGFDFRFALDVLPEPAIHVDLGDFRYLAARSGDELISILASLRGSAGYLQIIHASQPAPGQRPADPSGAAPPRAGQPAPDGQQTGEGTAPPPTGAGAGSGSGSGSDTGSGQPAPGVVITPGAGLPQGAGPAVYQPGQLAGALEQQGRVVLSDLDFATGSASLGAGPYGSLGELADWLRADPARRVALVGHTDATGSLEVNITVSRRRAEAVRSQLTGAYKIPAAQISAEGIGYLSPLLSHLAPDNQTANRRVEAVLLSGG